MRVCRLLRQFGRSIVEYNVFDTSSTDESIVRLQRWSTRLYIVVLSLAMMVLLFYTTLQVSLTQNEVENPSLSTYFDLYARHHTLKCPCTQISSLYSEFLQLEPIYRQICTSVFVSDQWMEFLFDNDRTTSRYAADFRATASHQFQTLRELCQLSITAVQNGLHTLYDNQLISGQLLSEDLFEAKLEADIAARATIASSDFWRELTFVRSLIFGNQLMPAVETAFTILVRSDTPGIIRSSPGVNTNLFQQWNGSECGCTDFLGCHMLAGFYDIDASDYSRGIFDQQTSPAREYLPRWYTGCWPSETLLLSMPEYLYNQTQLDKVLSYVNSSAPRGLFTALNASLDSFFDPSTTIETLTEEMFVEDWTGELNYSAYFYQCRPSACTMETNERASVLFIFTSLLGLYGGLSVLLLFVVPYVVTYVMKRLGQHPEIVLVEQPTTTEVSPSRLHGIKQFWDLLVNLNIFRSLQNNTALDQQRQRWSTRFYLLFLLLTVLFLTFYSWFSTGARIIQIKNPSLETMKDLQAHASSLQCPCTELSIPYEDLIHLEPQYHQACTSEFVTSKWIEGLNLIASRSAASLYYADFRYAGPIFQLLKSMCDLTNETVMNELFVFEQTQLVTADLIGPELFTEQLELAIEQFKVTMPNTLLRLLQFIRNFTYTNQFLSGSYANFFVDYSIVQEYAKPNTTLGIYTSSSTLSNGTVYDCSCGNDIACGRQAALYVGPSGARKVIFTLPGFYSRCFPVESLLPSTLECFYDNQPCLQSMASITNESLFTDVLRLNASQPSRFAINTSIDKLLEQLFMESWSSTLSYPSYFNKCRPALCSYTVLSGKSTLQVVTTIAGLIGGLSIALRILVPPIIGTLFILWRKCRPAQINRIRRPSMDLFLHPITIRQKLRHYITTMNTFEQTHKTTVTETELYLQRQSTRLYVVLLILAVLVLVGYTLLTYQKRNTTIKVSSFKEFQRLQKLYGSQEVDCPCTTMSFQRATFYRVEPVFHQICSSDFVDQDWLNALFRSYDNQDRSELNSFTFVGTAFAYFQTLRIMCDLTKQAVIDGQNLFLARQVVSADMPDYDIFNRLMLAAWTSFRSRLASSFVHTLHTLLGMAQSNGLVSAYSTNWGLFLPNMSKDATIYTRARIYNGCNCATSAICTQSSIPYVPGYVVGCLPMQSLLRSTLECLCNQSCVSTVASYVNATRVPRALNLNKSRFSPNLPINYIVEQMFIEAWSTNISYEKFFQQCRPTSCSYKSIDRYNVLYVVTTIVGLYGGLTVLLKLVIPFAVYRLHAWLRRIRPVGARVAPTEECY